MANNQQFCLSVKTQETYKLKNLRLITLNYSKLLTLNFKLKPRLRSSMDRIKDSGSFDLGSNPSEVTI